jgi:hypothetical protein
MPSSSRDAAESGICTSCEAEVRFIADPKTGAITCPECGARQTRVSEMLVPKPRVGRRVVDIDSANSKPHKPPPERTRAQNKQVAAVKRELSSHRPTGGALDGTGHGAAATAKTPARVEGTKLRQDDIRERWKALTDGLMSRHGRPHRAWDTYQVSDVLLHTKFGMGIVEKVAPDGWLTVLFRNGYQELPSGQARDELG